MNIGLGGYCLGFIDGVANTAQLYRRIAVDNGVGWQGRSWPNHLLLVDYVWVFVRYATSHPEYMQESAT